VKKIFFFLLMVFSTFLSANTKGGCELSQIGAVEVYWTAYKTAAKVGVQGSFDSVEYTPAAKSGENFRSILVGSKVAIDTATINSKHKQRDETLYRFFFDIMSDKDIEAKIVDIKADKRVKNAPRTGVVTIEIEMNGVKKTAPMKYSFSEGVFEAKGVIDILDFSANRALSSINKACFDLHEGKTWSDVAISFKMKIEAKLCNTK
jgi:hypothetical protein